MSVSTRNMQLQQREWLRELWIAENKEDYDKWKSTMDQLQQSFDEVEEAFRKVAKKPKQPRKTLTTDQ